MVELALARAEIVALRKAAEDPMHRRERGQGRRRGFGICRLAVIDEEYPVFLGHALHSMRKAGIGFERPHADIVIYAEFPTGDERGSDVLRIVRAPERGPTELIEMIRDLISGHHCPFARTIGHLQLDRIQVWIVDTNNTHVLVGLHLEQAKLRSAVGRETGIAIQMVGRDVEKDSHVAVEAVGQVELVG
jgi:hypothetical protein